MGAFLEAVAERYDSPQALAHRITLRLSQSNKYAFITEAGDDVFFYSSIALRLNAASHLEFYDAAGRPKVIETIEILRDLGKLDRCYAVVDRDFHFDDPELSFSGHCLTLDVYSFENYFMDADFLADFGIRYFALEAGSEEANKWRDSIGKMIHSLDSILLDEHLIALYCRVKNKKCLLENFRLNRNISVEADGTLVPVSDLKASFIIETKADVSAITDADIEVSRSTIAPKTTKQWFRGHYFWTMLVKLLNQYRETVDAHFKVIGRSRSRTRAEINERQAIEAAIAHINPPAIVVRFISSIPA